MEEKEGKEEQEEQEEKEEDRRRVYQFRWPHPRCPPAAKTHPTRMDRFARLRQPIRPRLPQTVHAQVQIQTIRVNRNTWRTSIKLWMVELPEVWLATRWLVRRYQWQGEDCPLPGIDHSCQGMPSRPTCLVVSFKVDRQTRGTSAQTLTNQNTMQKDMKRKNVP